MHNLSTSSSPMPKQVKSHNTTPALRDAICRMAESGFNTALIAELQNVSPATVRRLVANQRVRGHNYDLPRSGHPRKLDERALRHLNQSLEQDRRQTLVDLTNLVTTAC